MAHKHKTYNKTSMLLISMALNFAITFFEVIGGLLSGSLSLISDAVHNFSDALALILSFIAIKLAAKENTEERTFGYKRAQIVVALFNSSVLIIVSFFLFREAIIRFYHPSTIKSGIMISVAFIGLLANSISVLLLNKGKHENLNIRSAYMHLFSDMLSSIAVILGGIAIHLFDIQWVDPLLTIIIGIYVLKEGYAIVAQATHILMDFTPKSLDLKMIQKDIESVAGVKDVHHVHVRNVTEKDIHFEAHINASQDIRLSESCAIRAGIEKLLADKYAIYHATLQIEYDSCKNISLVKNTEDK